VLGRHGFDQRRWKRRQHDAALTGDASSAATRAVAVEHGGPTVIPAARALATAEEETVVLGSGAESGSDLRGRRRRWRAGTGRGGGGGVQPALTRGDGGGCARLQTGDERRLQTGDERPRLE
jgi:hypothetical protein